jgi:tRNA pseudouridine55 synthase
VSVIPSPDADSGAAVPPRAARAGLLAVDKPTGMTSHDVVDLVRRRLKVDGGHLGTLDPGASGLLLVAVGAATRCALVWQGGEKTYEATLRLGVVTSTQDAHGEVLERHPVGLTADQVRVASAAFVGELQQVPPMVSALKVGGRRLYALARRGVEVERAPRPVTVRRWDWLEVEPPLARFRVVCSGGTYVRTLAHDLGAALGCGAALEALRRLRSEPFGLEGAITLEELRALPGEETWQRAGVPLERALDHLPRLTLNPEAAAAIGYGARPEVALDPDRPVPLGAGPRSVVIVDAETGRVLALGEVAALPDTPGRARVCPHVVFPWAVREGRPA